MSRRMHDNSALIAQSGEELVINPVDSALDMQIIRTTAGHYTRRGLCIVRGQILLRVHRVSRAIGIEVGKIYRAQNHTKLAKETFVSNGVGLLMGMLSAQFVSSSAMSKACIAYGASCRSRRWSVATPARFFVLQRSFLLRWLCLPLRIISSTSIGLDAKGVNKQDRTRSRRAEPWSIVRRIYPAARPQ